MTHTFSVTRMRRPELLQLAAAIVFGASAFLPWYSTNPSVVDSNIHGHRGDVTAWAAYPVLRWFLLAAAVAALLSAWQTTTGQSGAQGVHRGEMSVFVAVLFLAVVVFCGVIDRPGSPPSSVSLAAGWFVALVSAVVALTAAIARVPRQSRRPPGA
jgi:hypothetical protein